MDTQHVRPQYPAPALSVSLPVRVQRFWRRVSEGMNISQLWDQLRTDARTTYRLYSSEIDATRPIGARKGKHFFAVARQFFWAILEKLTPARRVLLLIALIMLFIPEASMVGNPQHGWQFRFEAHVTGGLLMFGLLLLELTDRVVMKRDLQIAKEIQAWLLPSRPPLVPGLQIAFATRPANTVAGDYYDVFPRCCADAAGREKTGERFLMIVADVAGKSVPAAMLMATIQASLRTLSTTPGSLTDLVARMNHYTCSNSQNGRRFTTAFIAEYQPATRVLTYVNAGHNPPLLRRSSGALETLEVGGLPLGVMDNPAYESAVLTLNPGDLLAAYTDGLVEAENEASQEYGEARFRALLQANGEAPPELILSATLFDISGFVGTAPQHDDVTLMLIKAV